jgi:Carboxypeptidase regulatory-like domain
MSVLLSERSTRTESELRRSLNPNGNFTLRRAVVWVALTLGVAATALGQGERTSITGTVTDTSQAIIADAAVTVRDRATNVTTKTSTNSAGLYFITSLPPGDYDMTVEKSGFDKSAVEHIPLTLTLTATINVALHVGSVTQTVAVTATAVQLESQSSALQSTVTTRAVEDLPNIGGSPLAYAALAPRSASIQRLIPPSSAGQSAASRR